MQLASNASADKPVMTAEDQGDYTIEPASAPPPRRTGPPTQFQIGTAPPDLANDDVPCLNCGYNLRGLSPSSTCPECGTPVQRSLQGNLLLFSSPEYVGNLSRGLLFILIAVVTSIVVTIVGVIAMAVSGNLRQSALNPDFEVVLSVCMLPIAALTLYGWWLFSAPDPAIVGNQQGQKPRAIIRITVIIIAAAAVLDLLISVAYRSNPGIQMAAAGANIFSGVAGIAQFFASLLYIRWLAPRIPDQQIYVKANKYLWLLPVIYIVGMCVVVGPLIATIMYFLLLNTVRTRLAVIRERQASELTFSRTV